MDETTTNPDIDPVTAILAVIAFVGVYLLPAILARKRAAGTQILALNLFLGWTGLGWIIALVWAVGTDAPPVVIRATAPTAPASTADELAKLAALHASGALTAEEFASQKHRVLSRT